MKRILLVFSILISLNNFAQLKLHKKPYLKGTIELKSGEILKGFIKLKNSAFDVRFKETESQKKASKVKFKEIKEMITVEDSLYKRKFYYKKTDKSKFLSFVELIHKGKTDVYINNSIDLDLFYSKNKYISAEEWMQRMKDDFLFRNTNHLEMFDNYFALNNSIGVAGGGLIDVSKIDYFLYKSTDKTLIHIGSKGNFLYKNFKKTASKYFEDCPELVEKIKLRKLKLKHLTEILNFYNINCSK